MSTHCMIWVKVNEEDFGKTMTCDVNKLPNPIVENRYPCLPYTIHPKPLDNVLYLGIYCHFDGYPSGVGAELRKKFTTYESVLNLILLGGLSFLIDNVKAYHNWRNENLQIAKVQGDTPPFYDWGYTYIFENGKWVGEKIDD